MTFPTEAFYPHKIWGTNYYGTIAAANGPTHLNITPAQFLANGPNTDIGTIRKFGATQYRLFYDNSTTPLPSGVIPALAGPPTIVRVTSSADGSTITFKAGAFGELTVGVQQVWVTYTGVSGPLYGQWQSLDLTRSPNDDLQWEGTLTLPAGATSGQLRFIVQAANQVGLVALDTNAGAYYTVGNDPGQVVTPPAIASLELSVQPSPVNYGDDVTLGATLTAPGGAALAGQTIAFSVDTITRQAVTNSSGVATVDVPLALDPGKYLAAAAFGGTAAYGGATTSTPLTVRKQNSTLSLAPLPASIGAGATDTVVATLSDAAGQPIVDETVALIVSGSGGTYSSVLKTDVAGQAQLGLIPLPVGDYTVSAYFGGEIPPPVSASYTSPRYNPADPQSGALAIVAAADTTPPLTSIGSVPPDPSVGAEASFGFSADDNLTPAASLTFECSLDGGAFTACTSPKRYTTLRNGAHTFRVRAVDAAGNRDQTPAFHSWTVTESTPADVTPPSAAPTQQPPANSAGWNTTDVAVSWNWADEPDGSGIDSSNCTTTSSSSGEGVLTLTASCADQAGNTGTATYTVRIDKTRPTISAAATTAPNAAGWYNSNVTVRFTCVDAISGIPAGACPSDQILSAEGTQVASTALTVGDIAGNTSAASNVVTVKIDKTAPVTTGSAAVSANGVQAVVTLNAADGLSGIAGTTYRVNGGTLQSYNGPFTIQGAGAYSITYSSTDNAGNAEAPKTLSVSLALSCTPLGMAANYNLFILNNLNTTSMTIGGAVAVGQDGSFTSFSISGDIVVGRDASGSKGSVGGKLIYGRADNTNKSSFVVRGGRQQGTPINFAAEAQSLTLVADSYAALAANGTVTNSNGTLRLTGTVAGRNVFSVTSAQIGAAKSIVVSVPAGASVVINISGTSVSIRNLSISLNGATAPKVLWNAPRATTATISSVTVKGSLLMPRAALSASSGNFEGIVIANTYAGTSAGTSSTYAPCS
jgi:choice-of-anchor A domain-containing protein